MTEKTTGRPHGLTQDLIKKAKEYVNKPFFETYQKEVVVKDRIEVMNLERPTWVSVAGLAIELDVARATIYNWSDRNHESFNSEFLDIFEQLQKKQEMLLEYHGLTKNYDSGFAKFLACNLTKYKEKSEQQISKNVDIKLSYGGDKDD